MLCSSKELGLADDAEGLLILPKEAPIGKPLSACIPQIRFSNSRSLRTAPIGLVISVSLAR